MEPICGFLFALMALEHYRDDSDVIIKSDGAVECKHKHEQPPFGVNSGSDQVKLTNKACC
jgi:hypothetical protein